MHWNEKHARNTPRKTTALVWPCHAYGRGQNSETSVEMETTWEKKTWAPKTVMGVYSTVEADLNGLDLTWEEAEDLALQRDQWRRVAALCALVHGKD